MKRPIVTFLLLLAFAIAGGMMMAGCSSGSFEGLLPEKIVFDFETEADLDRLFWKCHVVYSLSDHHATHGRHSLKLELYPSAYPGITPILDFHDWQGYRFLCFDIMNPYDREETLTFRMDDMKVANDYGDRVNRRLTLIPGMNHVRISLETLETSGTKRLLNLTRIERFLLFQVAPKETRVYYLDNVRLVSGDTL